MTNLYAQGNFAKAGRFCAALFLCLLFTPAGCKTSDDATATATQMSETAKALSEYYAALHTMVRQTDQLNAIQEAMLPIPYSAADKKQIADDAEEIGKREELAETLSSVADGFTALTASSASKDAGTSATALQTEIGGIKALHGVSTATDVLAAMTGSLVQALQERDERRSARAMSDTIAAFHTFFLKEEPAYESLNKDYITLAQSLADNLVDRRQIDESYFVNDALGPFGVTPSVTEPELKTKIDALAKAQIDATAARGAVRFKKASEAMEKALAEMSRRVDVLAGGKAMTLRDAPATLITVTGPTR